MEERNAQLERDVARYQERKRIEKEASLIKHLGAQGTYLCNVAQISILEVLIPVNEYHEAKERYTNAREHQRALHARVTKLKNRNAPAHAKLESVFCVVYSGYLSSCHVQSVGSSTQDARKAPRGQKECIESKVPTNESKVDRQRATCSSAFL